MRIGDMRTPGHGLDTRSTAMRVLSWTNTCPPPVRLLKSINCSGEFGTRLRWTGVVRCLAPTQARVSRARGAEVGAWLAGEASCKPV